MFTFPYITLKAVNFSAVPLNLLTLFDKINVTVKLKIRMCFMKASKYIITTTVIILFVIFWVGGSKPLDKMTGIDNADSDINVTVMRAVELKQSDGSITYENAVIELDAPKDSEAAKAITKAMADITCRKRGIMLPFEKVYVYVTGQDNLSIKYSAGGKSVELIMLSGDSTVYDVGSKRRSFSVAEYSFEKLAKVAEQYGEVKPQL